MCQAKATLAYGLTVRTTSLWFAVKAWPRLEPVLPFFDLIFLRRRRGSLSTSVGSGAVTRVPDEVWEEVRRYLVMDEIEDSEETLVEQLFCEDPGCFPRSSASERATWKSIPQSHCDICQDRFHDWTNDDLFYWSKSFLTDVCDFLNAFGLDHPLLRPINVEPDSGEFSKSIALIAAPSRLRDLDTRRTEQPAIVEAACRGDYGPDEQTVIDVSFALPRNIDQRFIRFIRLFNLEVIKSSVNKLSSDWVLVEDEEEEEEGEVGEKEQEEEAGKFSGAQSKVVRKIKPRWRLWMTCISEW